MLTFSYGQSARNVLVVITGAVLAILAARGQDVPVMPSDRAIVKANANPLSERFSQRIDVVGTVTAVTPSSDEQATRHVYVEDSHRGTRLVVPDVLFPVEGLQRGDIIQAKGHILQEHGMEYLQVETLSRRGRAEPPAPTPVRSSDVLTGRYLARLVTLEGHLVVPKQLERDKRIFLRR